VKRRQDTELRWIVFFLFLLFGWALLCIRLGAATYTYTESNTAGVAQAHTCGSTTTSTQDLVLTRSGATTGTIATGNIAAGTSESWTFTGAASDPGLTSWDAGNWVTGINVSSADANVQWTDTCVFELNSGGTYVATVGTLNGQTTAMSTTGLKTHTVSGSAESPTATDRIQVVIVLLDNEAHGVGAISFTIGTSGNGETVATPIVQPTPTGQIIVISDLLRRLWPGL
jgi:hypothetical protein